MVAETQDAKHRASRGFGRAARTWRRGAQRLMLVPWLLAVGSSTACGGVAMYVTTDYVQRAESLPPQLAAPVARAAILLYALDDTVLAPPATSEGLADAIEATSGNAGKLAVVVNSRSSLAGGAAVATGAALLEGGYRSALDAAAGAMHAVSDDADSNRLFVFLRAETNQSIKPSVTSCHADAYLVLEDGTILHSHHQMNEQIYVGGRNLPSSTPTGMAQVLADNHGTLVTADGIDRPNYYLYVLTRWAIHDVAAQLESARGAPAPAANGQVDSDVAGR